MPDFQPLLRSIGLSASESKVYLAALEHGPSTVLDLAKRARLSRPATYDSIESLTAKGVMSSFLQGKRNRYTAESPERLLAFAENETRKRQSTLKEFAEALTDLRLLQGGGRPGVKFFEGLDGLRAIADDLLATQPSSTDEIANLDAVNEVFSPEELKPLRDRLIKLKSTGRALFVGKVSEVRTGVEARVLPNDSFHFFGDMVIYGNKVGLLTFKGKPVGVMIDNPVIAGTLRALFELAWAGAAKYPRVGDQKKA